MIPIVRYCGCLLLFLALSNGAAAAGQLDTSAIFGNGRSASGQGNAATSGFSRIFRDIATQTVNSVRATVRQQSSQSDTTPLYAPADAKLTVFPADNLMRFTLDNGNVIEYRDVHRVAPGYVGADGTSITMGTYVGELSASADKQGYARTMAVAERSKQKASAERVSTADRIPSGYDDRPDLVFSDTVMDLQLGEQNSPTLKAPGKNSQDLPQAGGEQNNTGNTFDFAGEPDQPQKNGLDGMSKYELAMTETVRRMTSREWAIQLTQAHPRSITIEIARTRAANLWLEQQIAEKKERVEALYATLLAIKLKNSH